MEFQFLEFVERITGKAIFAVAIPYQRRLQIDLLAFANQIERLKQLGVEAFAVGKSSGLYTLSEPEVVQLTAMIRLVVKDQAIVLMPLRTSMFEVADTYFRDSGADGVLVMDPSIAATDDDLIRYYRAIATRLPGVPAVIYKTGALPTVEAIKKLIDSGTIAGVKWGPNAGKVADFSDLVYNNPMISWQAACGEASNSYYSSAHCWWSGGGVVTSDWTLAQINALVSNDLGRVLQIANHLKAFDEFRMKYKDGLCNIGAIYTALEIMGNPIGQPRPPIHQLILEEHSKLADILWSMQENEGGLKLLLERP